MKIKLPALVITAVVLAGAWIVGSKVMGPGPTAGSQVQVNVPRLSAMAVKGQATFADNCATCHGDNASGSDQGPPLIHDTYNPGHHADEAFRRAIKNGTRQHHWPYGNMPPQPQVTAMQAEAVIAYVRELQRANGIVTRPHQM